MREKEAEKMLLYIIRHGESEANAGGYHSGQSCVHLTERGRKQAACTREYVKDIPFDRLFVSDVLRTQETAEVIFPGMERTFIPLAREIDNTTMHGKTKEEMTELYGQAYLDCREKFDYAPLGIECESLAHLSGRAKKLLAWAEKQEDERICIVSHAGFIVALAGQVLGLEAHSRALLCDNASVSVFEFKNGKWRLKLWNFTQEEQKNIQSR